MDPRGIALKLFAVSALTLMSWFGVKASPVGGREWCNYIPGLSAVQMETCKNADGLQTALHRGLHEAVELCEREFKQNRWNCSMMGNSSLLFRAPDGTAEAAFATALTAAGLALHVSIACRHRSSLNCACDVNKSFCSPNATSPFDFEFTRSFLATSSNVDKHNVKVGLKALKQALKQNCPSDNQCSSLEKVSAILKRKYSRAQRALEDASTLRLMSNSAKSPRPGELVYINQSPDYCTRDEQAGIAGTQGRACLKAGSGCTDLCCGRGYSHQTYNVTKPCNATFVVDGAGRVQVKTKTCIEVVSGNFCN